MGEQKVGSKRGTYLRSAIEEEVSAGTLVDAHESTLIYLLTRWIFIVDPLIRCAPPSHQRGAIISTARISCWSIFDESELYEVRNTKCLLCFSPANSVSPFAVECRSNSGRTFCYMSGGDSTTNKDDEPSLAEYRLFGILTVMLSRKTDVSPS